MPFFANLGYSFTLPNNTGVEMSPDGGIILASAMPRHELTKRFRKELVKKQIYLKRRLFDPQLYLASLDPNETKKHCSILATYPWFGVKTLNEYESGLITPSNWRKEAKKNNNDLWPKDYPNDPEEVKHVCGECIELQLHLNCEALILPSPLTTDSNSDYERELVWLDKSLEYIREKAINKPAFATVALSDNCLRYAEPTKNTLLELLMDNVSARRINGVYVFFEQAGAPDDSRQSSNTRALHSLLHLVHIFANDSKLRVIVNWLGHFGLACRAAGAETWASGWYKSVYRLRLADKLGKGFAFPRYWSTNAAVDIDLKTDFDLLSQKNLLAPIEELTEASIGLLQAAKSKAPVKNTLSWAYRSGNVKSAREHYFRSCIAAESMLTEDATKNRDIVEGWLIKAAENTYKLETALPSARRTKTEHVQAWLTAFQSYRKDHSV